MNGSVSPLLWLGILGAMGTILQHCEINGPDEKTSQTTLVVVFIEQFSKILFEYCLVLILLFEISKQNVEDVAFLVIIGLFKVIFRK